MRGYLFFGLVLGFMTMATAQDIRFSQYYQAPLYLNPAFTGSSGGARIGTNYRLQGTSSESSYTTLSAYGDYYFKDFYASAGLLFISDRDAYSGYVSNSVAIPLSYDFSITKNITIKPAIQPSYTLQGIDFGRFLFSDQIDPQGNITGGTSEPLAGSDRIGFFDVATGVLAFSERWWVGYSMHNLLDNNISFVTGGESRLPIRYSAHGGVSISLNDPRSRNKTKKTIMPTFNFVSQGKFNQLDAGAIFQLEPIVFGAMYRGIPNPLYEGDYSAVSWVVGINKYDFSLGYSFDMPIKTDVNPGGIHEISLSFLFDPTDPNATPRSAKRLKCPLPY